MRLWLLLALVVANVNLVYVASGWAADQVFSNLSTLHSESARLVSEAKEVVSRPVDIENSGMWRSLVVIGAKGLVYTLDDDIRREVGHTRSDGLDKATDVGNFIGNPLVHLGIAGAVYGGGAMADSPRYRQLGMMLGEAAVLADASTFALKSAIGRARPDTEGGRHSFRPFSFDGDYDSFPSMHTASSFAMASVISGTGESLTTTVIAYTAALFSGFSRLYEDKHWGSDIVMGAAIGELCGRVVIDTHAREGSRLRFTPMVSRDTVSIALTGSW